MNANITPQISQLKTVSAGAATRDLSLSIISLVRVSNSRFLWREERCQMTLFFIGNKTRFYIWSRQFMSEYTAPTCDLLAHRS